MLVLVIYGKPDPPDREFDHIENTDLMQHLFSGPGQAAKIKVLNLAAMTDRYASGKLDAKIS